MKPNPNHNFNPAIEKTEIDIAKFVINLINEKKDILIFPESAATDPTDDKKLQEAATDFGITVLKYIATTDIPADYAGHSIERVMTLLKTLQGYIEGNVRQEINLFSSLSLGVRSPISGKYRAEVVTYAQLLQKIEEVKEKIGFKKSDYFDDEPAEAEVSPIQPNDEEKFDTETPKE